MFFLYFDLCAQSSHAIHLFLITGSSCPRRRARKDRSSEYISQSALRKSATMGRKGKEMRTNYKDMDSIDYAALRQKNWYEDVERDLEIEDTRFWCTEQLFIYKDIYQNI